MSVAAATLSPMTYSPQEHATRLNIPIIYADIGDDLGRWYPDLHIIALTPALTRIEERCTIAHELGHVCLGHRASSPKHERMADRWAARKLINPHDLADIAAGTPDAGRWCLELDVTPHILTTYLSLPEARQWHSQRSERLAG